MKLTELRNPLKADKVNVLSIGDWIGSIGFVAWIGLVMALGAKALTAADKVLPGNNTPNYYKNVTAEPAPASGVTIL